MHEVVEVKYLIDYKLLLIFEDGKKKVADFQNDLWGEMFEPLNDIEFFKKARVDPELGTIVWPNGLDICPDSLYNTSTEELSPKIA